MIEAIKEFWDWFTKNNKAYLFINEVDENVKEELLDKLQKELHQYCDKLWFEIGGYAGEDHELIITAEGDTNYFKVAEELVEGAPKIEHWTFIALVPPLGPDYTINFEGVELKTKEIWFLPLESSNNPNGIGIRVCLRNYELVKDNEALLSTIHRALDTILGERSSALDINRVEVDQLPDDPEEHGMIVLAELPEYVSWKKKKRKP